MQIKFFGNDRQYQNLKSEWNSAVEKVWASGQYFSDGHILELEKTLAHLCGRQYAVALNSCTDALFFALNSAEAQKTLVSNFSFLASATGILRNAGTPYFVDIKDNHFSASPAEYQKIYNQNSQIDSLIHVSLFGDCGFNTLVESFSKEHSLFMIEDSAQSFGSYCEDRPAGNFGHVSCLSFDPTKIIAGTSGAGALLTDDEEVYQHSLRLRLHGRDARSGEFQHLGYKSLMASSEAAILLLKLKYLDSYIHRRREIAQAFNDAFSSNPWLITPHTQKFMQEIRPQHVFHKYVLTIKDSKQKGLQQYLKDHGIETRVHYPKLISDENVFHLKNQTPIAQGICSNLLSLPIYPELKDEEVDKIIHTVNSYFESL